MLTGGRPAAAFVRGPVYYPAAGVVVACGLVLRNLRAFRAFRLSSPDRLVVDVLH